MNAKEAYKKIVSELQGQKVIRCREYDSRFVFETVPTNYEPNGKSLMDSLTSVNKKTGEVRDFKPFHIPVEEYKKGRDITDFK